MFVSEEQTLTVSLAVAASRLARLAGASWLREVSETVYQGGMEYPIRVGPAPRAYSTLAATSRAADPASTAGHILNQTTGVRAPVSAVNAPNASSSPAATQ
jgi:hypothetical protein